MKRITKYTFAALTLTFLLAATACGAADNEATAPTAAADVTYEQLSAEQAKEIMDSEQSYYLIDARTDAEFAEGHIAGAVVIPEYEIAQRAENEIADKDRVTDIIRTRPKTAIFKSFRRFTLERRQPSCGFNPKNPIKIPRLRVEDFLQ